MGFESETLHPAKLIELPMCPIEPLAELPISRDTVKNKIEKLFLVYAECISNANYENIIIDVSVEIASVHENESKKPNAHVDWTIWFVHVTSIRMIRPQHDAIFTRDVPHPGPSCEPLNYCTSLSSCLIAHARKYKQKYVHCSVCACVRACVRL